MAGLKQSVNVKVDLFGLEEWIDALKEFQFHAEKLEHTFDRAGAAMKLHLTGYHSPREGEEVVEYKSVGKLFEVVAMTIVTEHERKQGELPKILKGPVVVVAQSEKAARDAFIAQHGADWDLDWTEVVALPFAA